MRRNFGLTPEQRADARSAYAILEGTGLTLELAARLATGKAQDATSTRLDEAMDAYIRDALARNLRRRSVDFYESKFSALLREHEDATLDDFTRPRLRQWIQSRGGSVETRQGFVRALRALFKWARRQDPPKCLLDPTDGLRIENVKEQRAVKVFTPEQSAELMTTAGDYQAAAALMLFAGVRPSEINAREKPTLTWGHVDFANKSIRIPAEIAKTRVTRIIESLPDNLWVWLDFLKGDGDKPICHLQTRFLSRHCITHPKTKLIQSWPQDGCRHSFATYHIAAYGSPEKTSLILGHEGKLSLMHQRYRGLATKAQAENFFKIMPPKKAT